MTGTLGLFSLVDLFQLLAGASRTGRLVVEHPRGDARIYFEKGDVTHATFDGDEGAEAVYALFADERGTFAFSTGLPAPRRTVKLGTRNLVLEAVRRLDEARRDADDDVIPYESDMVPERSGDAASERVDLGAHERGVLDRIDGRRSLQRIAELAERPFVEVSRIAGRLVAAGVIVVRKRRPRTARLVVRAASTTLPPGAAMVDAGIVEAWTRALGERPDEVLGRRENGAVDRFRLLTGDGTGPFLLLGHATLMRTGLMADEPLLVRPAEDGA